MTHHPCLCLSYLILFTGDDMCHGEECWHVTAPLRKKEARLLFLLIDILFSVLYQLS